MSRDIFRKLTFGVKRTKSAQKKPDIDDENESALRLRSLPENIRSELKELRSQLSGEPTEIHQKLPENDETGAKGVELLSGIQLADDEGPPKKKKKQLNPQNDEHLPVIQRRIKEKIAHLRRLNRIYTWGDNIPDPLIDFDELQLPIPLQNSLSEFGIKEPTPIQMQSVPLLLQKRDVLCSAPTGSGKTLAFALPAIIHVLKAKKLKKYQTLKEKPPLVLVLEPTRELAAQTYRQFLKFANGVDVSTALFQEESIPKNIDILVSTPNRICHHIEDLNLSELRWLIIDESDRLFEVVEGQERCFRNQLATIYKACTGQFTRRALFSATFSYEVEEWCKATLNNVAMVCIGERNSSNLNVSQELVFAGSEHGKVIAVRDLLSSQFEPPALIFVQSKDRARELVKAISNFRPPVPVAFISSEKSQKERENVLEQFRAGHIWVLVCTELIGRGLDLKNVSLVINFDLPTSIVSYIHRVGRTGRAGRLGRAVTYFTESDAKMIRPIATVINQAGFSVPEYTLSLKNPNRHERHQIARHAPKRKHITHLKKKFKRTSDVAPPTNEKKRGGKPAEETKKKKIVVKSKTKKLKKSA